MLLASFLVPNNATSVSNYYQRPFCLSARMEDRLDREVEKLNQKVKRMEKTLDRHFKRSPHDEFFSELRPKNQKARVTVTVTTNDKRTEEETWIFVWRHGKVRGLKRKVNGSAIFYNQVRAKEGELRFFRDLAFGKRERLRLTHYRTGKAGGDVRINEVAHEYTDARAWFLCAHVQLQLSPQSTMN